LRHLDTAYVNFFRKTAKFPRFKSKKDKNSFHIPQHIVLENKKLYLPKFKSGIKVNLYLDNITNIRNCSISKTPLGKYYVSFLCEVEYNPKPKTGKSVGIDLGLKDFVITSDEKVYENHKYTKKYEKELRKLQQHLSRKVKGSSNKDKARLKVAKLHQKISNSRGDLLHKVSCELVNNYDVICSEDLNVKGMVKNHHLSKFISDVAWGTFLIYLKYKCEWNDKKLVKIDRFFPSSKMCNKCNHINQDLTLKVREWTCPSCNTIHNRDINASKNILREGLNLLSLGTSDYTCGGGGYEASEARNN
jgi:putative transposase